MRRLLNLAYAMMVDDAHGDAGEVDRSLYADVAERLD